MPVSRTWFNTLVDDDGSNTVGTVWNKAGVGNILTEVDKVLVYGQYTNANSQSIANNVHVPIEWTIEDYDPFNLHPTATGSGISPPALYGGIYFMAAHVSFNANGTGTRAAAIRMNGTTIVGGAFNYVTPSATNLTTATAMGVVSLLSGGVDYAEVLAYQTSGAPLTLGRATLSVFRIG